MAERRVNINFLLAPSGRAAIDDLGAQAKATRSDTIRAMLKVAMKHKSEVLDALRGRL